MCISRKDITTNLTSITVSTGMWMRRSVTDYAHNADKKTVGGDSITGMKWLDKDHAWYMKDKELMLARYEAASEEWAMIKLVTMPDKAEHVTIDKSRKIAYTIDNNLWLW